MGRSALFPLLETIGVIPRFEDVAVVGDAVQQGRGHLGISEYLHPLGEVEIGGDDQGRLFIQGSGDREPPTPRAIADVRAYVRCKGDGRLASRKQATASRPHPAPMLRQGLSEM